jgi:hypothetical protein
VGTVDVSNTAHTNAGTYPTDYWFFTGTANYNSIGNTTITDQIDKAPVTATAGSGSNVYDAATHSPSGCMVTGAYKGDLTCANDPASVGPNAGTYPINPVVSGTGLSNFEITSVPGSYTISKAPTVITPDSNVEGVNNDCTNNTYTATLTDAVTGQDLGGISLKMTIGTQNTTASTNASETATFTLTLFQAPGTVMQKFELNQPWTDPNRYAPALVSRDFTVVGDPTIGPGTDADSLYTGSLFFWTTSSTSSTATLTLSATIKDTFDLCPTGDITKAKVSFYVSTNGGSSFSPVSNAQNLPVGLVNPNEPNVGAASAISQYNIGNTQSVTLVMRVVVGGYYDFSESIYDQLITIGKPGTVNSLMGGGTLVNDGYPYLASGYLGVNSIKSSFGSQVIYNKKGVNPQGQVTVTIRSCNKVDGTVDANCDPDDPSTHHVYWIKSNSISELSLISGSASFGAKTNGYELLPDGSKANFDSGNSIQLIFTPYNKDMPLGAYKSGYGGGTPPKCTNAQGCASIVLFRSAGGIWYSSSWGAPSNSTIPRTVLKDVVNGCVSVGDSAKVAIISTKELSPTPVNTTTPTATFTANRASLTLGFVGSGSNVSSSEPSPDARSAGDPVSHRKLFVGHAQTSNRGADSDFVADGSIGRNWIGSHFDSSVESITNGTTPDGRVTVTVRTCNKPDGSVDTRCVPSKPSTHHVYVFETDVLSESSLLADIATFGSRTIVYELLSSGNKKILDQDVSMQIVFVAENQMIPLTIGAAGGSACTEKPGCAAIAARRADGSLWYSGGWRLSVTSDPR